MHGQKESLLGLIRDEFHGDPRAVDLFDRFLHCGSYSRWFVVELIEVARGSHADSWELRRLATLMLQQHLLALDVEQTEEFDFVLQQLEPRKKRGGKMPLSVLKEGYSTRKLRGFVAEFRRRLTRPRCSVQRGSRKEVAPGAVRDFVHQSRQDCKLVLGRYVFTPDEVVARIREQVITNSGLPLALIEGILQIEARRALADLPDYEASILQKLRSDTTVYWVADKTPSRLNSLVEYPLGTVVLVVKPPGSHYEFELKRAGRRGKHPLSARSHVPPSHRLDGGSMVSALQWDAEKTAVFGNLYRRVHAEPAPISKIVNVIGKSEVPVGDGHRLIVEYLNDRAVYGEGFDEMRKAMAIVVDCFRTERGNVAPSIPGKFGLTAQFFAFGGPAQAVICGSSSFRLDLLATYLSAEGPAEYLGRGLQIDYQDCDAKQLADDLLEEVLGVYKPPKVSYQDYRQYVEAALSASTNRARADAIYLSLCQQIGGMWGTLLAVRGYSHGESFVARNVGLRTVWSGGKWCVRIVFQDHDNLVLPGWDGEYRPMHVLPPTIKDGVYISGMPGDKHLSRELFCLRQIYRVDDGLERKGRKQLRKALKRAYVKTHEAIEADRRPHPLFQDQFVDRLRDWDAVARRYAARNGSGNGRTWKSRVVRFLQEKGYRQELIDEHCLALEKYGDFVDQYSFLFRAKIGDQ